MMMILMMTTTTKNKGTLVLYDVSLRALRLLGTRIACYVGYHKCALVLALTSVFLLCVPERSTGAATAQVLQGAGSERASACVT